MDAASPILPLDRSLLGGVVSRSLHRPSAVVVDWQPPAPLTDTVAVTNPSSGGVYRVRGTATDGGQRLSWSVILKALRSPAGAVVPDGTVVPREFAENRSGFNYWRREPLAYQTGLLDNLPGGLAAPRYLGATEHPDERIWLWLEDLADGDGPAWAPSRPARAARHLGAFNAAYLVDRPLPDAPWLSSDYLRSFLDPPVAGIVRMLASHRVWQHPLLQSAFPPPAQERLHRLWTDREILLAALDRLPPTFAHLDAFRSNLFSRRGPDGAEQTVAIDWAFAGRAALGEELAPLVFATAVYDFLSAADLRDLEATALDAYTDGLADSGWDGGRQAVQLAYCASAALRYTHLLTADVARLAFDGPFRTATEARHGRSFFEIARQRATLVYLLLDRADQARRLLAGA